MQFNKEEITQQNFQGVIWRALTSACKLDSKLAASLSAQIDCSTRVQMLEYLIRHNPAIADVIMNSESKTNQGSFDLLAVILLLGSEFSGTEDKERLTDVLDRIGPRFRVFDSRIDFPQKPDSILPDSETIKLCLKALYET